MLKYFIFILIFIFGALVWMYAGIEGFAVKPAETPEMPELHHYQDTAPIGEIAISAFYFVPKNKQNRLILSWRELLQKNLNKLAEFHNLQFQGRSRINYQIYPNPIIGQGDNLAYDTDVTQHGNPEALRRIAGELEERVFGPRGDLRRTDFIQHNGRSYQVLVILYEGVGASGSDNVALLSRTFLTDSEYSDFGPTFLAHEFYHTLGIPDGYELPTSIATNEDIMGIGRARLLEKTYISRSTLRAMGL